MPDTLALWHADHLNFAKLLTLLEAQLAPFHDGGTPEYELMQDIMYYLTHCSDVVHHPKEDLVFARLAEREPGARQKIDELTAEHARLKEAGDALARTLDDIVNGAIISRERLEAMARSYVANLRSHIQFEEAEMLPLAGRVLKPGDWSAIHAAIGRIPDPLFGTTAEKRYAALRRRIELRTGPSPSPGTRRAQSPG